MDNNASSPNRLKPFHYFPQKFYRHNQASFLSSHFPQQQPKSTNSMFQSRVNNNSPNLNLNHLDDTINNDEDTDINNDPLASTVVDKEPLFEKPLTPSDVGKLNRLVIPKQYAEKYFPLAGGDSEEKGLLLNFEDELGKFWRFRYSYWNSSQSYVLTKGWSRYVKEKRLDAGDVVLFLRHCSDYDRFFIGWRRRASAQDSGLVFGSSVAQVSHGGENCGGGSRDGWTEILYSAHEAYPTHHHHHHHHHHQNHALPYQPDYLLAGSSMGETQVSSVGNSRILRLFGVNMECQAQVDDDEESSDAYAPDGSSLSSQGSDHLQLYPTPAYYSNQMDYNFARDIKPMRNQRG